MPMQITVSNGTDVVQVQIGDQLVNVLDLNSQTVAEQIEMLLSRQFKSDPKLRAYVDSLVSIIS